MNRITISLLFIAIIFIAPFAEARTVTAYRTIIASADSEAEAAKSLGPGAEVLPYRGKFVVVEGWHENFEDAMPEGVNPVWNQRWRHVLPVDMSVDEMSAKGLNVDELKRDAAVRRMGGLPMQLANRAQLSSRISPVVQSANQKYELFRAKPHLNDPAELAAMLKPIEDDLIAVAERSPDRAEAETAQLWLARAYYWQGVEASEQRLPKTSFNHERVAWATEENFYDSAMREFDRFLERYPDSLHAEEVEYFKAATAYHLTYRGHHRHQVEKARDAYQGFVDKYPQSDRAPRAKLNLLGIALELARMDQDDASFQYVINVGEDLLETHPDAGDYLRGRASIIVAEAYNDGFQNYPEVIARCRVIIDEFSGESGRSIIGTAHRLKGYAHMFLEQLEEAAAELSFVIDFYEDFDYHFGYQVEENIAAAYYWRGQCLKKLGFTDESMSDFVTCSKRFPGNKFGLLSQDAIQVMN